MEDRELIRKISKGQPLRENQEQFQNRKPLDPVVSILVKQIGKSVEVHKKNSETLHGTLRAVQPNHLGVIIEQDFSKKKIIRYIRGDAIEEICINQV